jgi:hypothetical protein
MLGVPSAVSDAVRAGSESFFETVLADVFSHE